MPKGKRKIKCPSTLATFNPAYDVPLRYFSTKETFVRSTSPQNYKLYCGQYMVMMLTRDGFAYKYPSYKSEYDDYIEAFIDEYAPHIHYHKMKSTLSTLKPVYIGLPEPVTL